MKGHDGMKLPELKKVVRSQDTRYPGMLTMKKADLIRNMKKRGMWETGKATRTGGAPKKGKNVKSEKGKHKPVEGSVKHKVEYIKNAKGKRMPFKKK